MDKIDWKNITLVGLGSQGSAWAQNLRESGRQISCFLRPNSPKKEKALELGLSLVNSVDKGHPLLLLIPDHQIKSFLEENKIKEGTPLIYAHGASLLEHGLQNLFPQFDHCLLAPKAIASELRESYKNRGKVGAVYSVEFSKNKEALESEILSLAKDLGITAGPYPATFEQETRADLLSEQTLLCGLIPYAAKMCFDRLRKEGIPKELAYLEAWHEVKLIGNAMSQFGPEGLFSLISPHALVGAELASQEFFDKAYQETIESLHNQIKGGQFFEKAHRFFKEGKDKEVQEFWKESEINSVYNQLKNDLTSS